MYSFKQQVKQLHCPCYFRVPQTLLDTHAMIFALALLCIVFMAHFPPGCRR